MYNNVRSLLLSVVSAEHHPKLAVHYISQGLHCITIYYRPQCRKIAWMIIPGSKS